MPTTPVLFTAWILAFAPAVLIGQEIDGLIVADDASSSPVELAEAGSPSSLGPTLDVLPRAEVSPNRALAPGAVADNTDKDNRLPVQFGVTLAGYYDDNIYVAPGGAGRVGDLIYQVVPFVSYNSAAQTGVDNSIQVSYAPGFIFYQRHSGNNTVEQNGSFIYGYQTGRSTLAVTQQYISVQNSGPDLGDLVKVTEYLTTVNFDYSLTTKLGLTLRAQQDIVSYDQGFDSNQWTGSAYLGYELFPKTTIALGSLVGVVDLEGPNQDFVQINGRVIYNPTEKLSFNGTGGVEFRQTQGYGSTVATPVFSGGFSYTPWDDTNLSANVYREYNYSAKLFGEDYLATGTSASITQAFYHKLFATLSGSFENAHYEDNFSGDQGDQNYNYFSFRAALDYQLESWVELSAYYQYRRDISHSLSGFTDNQVGLQSRFYY
jgi:hypothetical protein